MNIYFNENNCDIDAKALEKAVKEKAEYNKTKVIEYLEKGMDIGCCPKECLDVFDGEFIDMSFSIKTDGEFNWRSDLQHYVKKYNIELPKKFINKI